MMYLFFYLAWVNYWIVAAVIPGVAAEQSPNDKSGTFSAAMGFKTIAGILRAAGFKFTLRSEKWAEGNLVSPDKQYCGTINNLHLKQPA
jgi:hypothetical protein